ncbi:MAG: hypothetical protein JWN39_4138, partial [Ilumatobacteraceae bacterium]|nr:hypothetical protein [Ilumatobacteraceae bacterium]
MRVTRTNKSIAALLCAMVVVASSCSSDSKTAPTTTAAVPAGSAAATVASVPSTDVATTASAGTDVATTAAGTEPQSTDASVPTSATTGGPPIKIGLIGIFQSTVLPYAYPEIQDLIEARIKQINDDGGIAGRQLQLTSCNDGGDANQAEQCARDAVSAGDVAVLGGETNFADSILPVLESANVAWIGNALLSPSDGTSEASFPMDGGVVTAGVGVAAAATDAGCKKLGVMALDFPTGIDAANWMKGGMEALGGSAEIVKIPLTALPDFNAQVATLESANVDCLSAVIAPTDIPKFVAANSLTGSPLPLILPNAEVGPVIESLGASGDGILAVGDFYQLSDPKAKTFTDWVAKYAPDVKVSPVCLPAYTGTYFLESALKDAAAAGDITPESVLKAMGEQENISGTMNPPFSTTKELSLP